MEGAVVQFAGFVAQWHAAGLTDEDLQALEALLDGRPLAGPVMAGTGGVRKLRFAPPSWHTGKSGATRVAYAAFPADRTVYLLALLQKRESANFSPATRAAMRSAMAVLARLHART